MIITEIHCMGTVGRPFVPTEISGNWAVIGVVRSFGRFHLAGNWTGLSGNFFLLCL